MKRYYMLEGYNLLQDRICFIKSISPYNIYKMTTKVEEAKKYWTIEMAETALSELPHFEFYDEFGVLSTEKELDDIKSTECPWMYGLESNVGYNCTESGDWCKGCWREAIEEKEKT